MCYCAIAWEEERMNEWSSWSSAVLLRNARNRSRTTVSAVSGIGASLASYGSLPQRLRRLCFCDTLNTDTPAKRLTSYLKRAVRSVFINYQYAFSLYSFVIMYVTIFPKETTLQVNNQLLPYNCSNLTSISSTLSRPLISHSRLFWLA